LAIRLIRITVRICN